MLDDLKLMSLHVRALFTHNAESRLLQINEPGNAVAPAPRLFLGRTRAGNIWRFHADLPPELIQELDSLCGDEPPLNTELNVPPRHLERYVQLLEPVENVSSGPAYYFPKNVVSSKRSLLITVDDAEMLKGGFEEFVDELPAWQPFVAVVAGDRTVSVCRSARITPDAHEAGVETLPDFRGRGYAKDATAEWAQRVRAIGATPLYSTSWENKASQAVARKLSLECYGVDLEIV
jgi:RimJ/RimL family protein N-acetyltransferase